tara:strand:+ start:6096 stop:6389 length:294 start_codon:yes stop_codon:yes gene_type:complete
MNIFRFLTILWFASFCLGFLTACSYSPVVDLRASQDDAQLYQRDLMECRELAKQVDYSIFPTNHKAVARCLAGRGHSVLDDFGSNNNLSILHHLARQ